MADEQEWRPRHGPPAWWVDCWWGLGHWLVGGCGMLQKSGQWVWVCCGVSGVGVAQTRACMCGTRGGRFGKIAGGERKNKIG